MFIIAALAVAALSQKRPSTLRQAAEDTTLQCVAVCCSELQCVPEDTTSPDACLKVLGRYYVS